MIPVTTFKGKSVALFGLGGSGLATALALAAGGADVINHRLCGAHRATAAIDRTAQIVDQHLGAARCQRQRMLAAQATTGARHDGHTALEVDTHESFSCCLFDK